MMNPPSWVSTPLPPTWHELQIISTGQKNLNSAGNEVYLIETRDIDGSILPVTQYQLSDSWIIDDHHLFTRADQYNEQAVLTYRFYGEWGKDIELLFKSSTQGGMAEVILDGKKELIDLYDRQEGETYVTVSTSGKIIWRIVLSILDICSVAFLIYILINISIIIKKLSQKMDQISNALPRTPDWMTENLEWITLVPVTGLMWLFLYQHAGGPSAGGIGGNDNLWYLYNAMFPNADASGLNRYVYIYILKIFVFIAHGEPSNAVKLSWSFWIAGTATLVYINARLVSNAERNFPALLKGILAVTLFLSMPTILTLQTSLADHPLMFMVMLCVLLYVLYIRSEKKKQYLLIIFGALFFLTFKIKESCLPLAILFAGLCFDGYNDEFHWGQFKKQMKYIFIGMVSSLLIVMLLDQIFIGDALFGFRMGNWEALVDTNVNVADNRSNVNWYSFLTYDNRILIVSILSLLNLYWMEKNGLLKHGMRFIWLLPFGLILFLSLTIIASEWNVLYRYMMWSLPIFCFLSVQFMHFESKDLKDIFNLLLAIAGSFCVVCFTCYYYIFPIVEKYYHWDSFMFHNAVLMPMAFTALIMMIMVFRNFNRYGILKFAIFCCLFYIIFPSNYIQTVWQDEGIRLMNKEWANKSEYVYLPYQAFESYIDYSIDETVFISDDIFDKNQMLSKNPLFNHWSFSTYFGIDSRQDHFYSGSFNMINIEEDIPYDYAFLYRDDWMYMSNNVKTNIEKKYKVYQNSNEDLFFLKKIK